MKKQGLISLIIMGMSMLSVHAAGNKTDTYYVEKGPRNIFITGGVGSLMGLSATNFDAGFFKAQNPYVYLGVGRMFHPNWSYRAVFTGWRASDFITQMEDKANFVNLQLDLMYNMSNAWGGYKEGRIFEASVFAGPYINYSTAKDEHPFHVFPGISLGLQFKFNVNEHLAIDLEGRVARQREMACANFDRVYAMPTVGVTYTFGGKQVKKAVAEPCLKPAVQTAAPAESEQLAQYKSKADGLQQQVDELAGKNAELTRTVEDLEARAKVKTAGPVALFFTIGSAEIDERGVANIQLAAEMIKNDPYNTYLIRGYADMSTGSVERNRNLSEERAQAVYNALVAAGVDGTRLEVRAMGGHDNVFGKDELNRMVIIEKR